MRIASLCLAMMMSFAARSPAGGVPIDDPVAGEKLARELRGMQPQENAELTGTLRISKPNSLERVLPLRMKVTVMPAGKWKSVYEVRLANGGVESLAILHATNQPPQYELRRGDAVDAIVATNSTAPFAGSDFMLLDLGLEFLNWPTQIVIAKEMRKGRGCDVLESRPARTNAYARVLSWIDQETSGLLMAEGYDARGKLLKEFEVNSVDKATGRVRKMEMRNRQEKTGTRLQFEFDKE